jgi:hypothetical protein
MDGEEGAGSPREDARRVSNAARAVVLSLALAGVLILSPALPGLAKSLPANVQATSKRPLAEISSSAQTPVGQPTHSPEQSGAEKLQLSVVDETGVAVTSAHLTLVQQSTQTTYRAETDYAGRHEFTELPSGVYSLRVEKPGFYAVRLDDVRVGETETLEVSLNHQQEFVEHVNVTYSPPHIDATATASNETLTSREILNLPYPTTRDIRYALPLLPGVLQDSRGQLHVEGSAPTQLLSELDGFNITHPASGTMELRVSVDALRSLDVESSRNSAAYGKGSGGVLNLATGMGDDRFRFSATNFIPSVQNEKGLTLDNWTPRATFSGPLRRGRAWFLLAPEGEYGVDVFRELPKGADRSSLWRMSNFSKVQVNLGQSHILSGTFLLNHFHSGRAGLSPFNPVQATRDLDQGASFFSLKDQAYLPGGLLFETGVAVYDSKSLESPLGDLPYEIHPDTRAGNFFRTSDGRARRTQWIANFILPPVLWNGRHEFKLGTDLDWIGYRQSIERRPISIYDAEGRLTRQIVFDNAGRFRKPNFEASGYAQDRWSPSERLLLEIGLRSDWDEILCRVSLSPRFSSTYLLSARGDTKLSFGIGVYHDATNLDLIARPLSGQRFDLFFAPDGSGPVGEPVETLFRVDERGLGVPRYLNWSVGLERKLPASIYLRADYLRKRGTRGMAFYPSTGASGGLFDLRSARRDHYDAIQIALRRTFKGNYMLFGSFAHSSARSNAVLDFGFDDPTLNPLVSRQAGGPLPWDAPNRLLTWGWLPLVKGFNLAYTLDWRSGFPFSIVNGNQEIVGAPNSRRFPGYFSLNLHLERRFRLLSFQWALRAGFDNLTGRQNPSAVNNNVDSPQFLAFSGYQGRVFTGRIRFLGRK